MVNPVSTKEKAREYIHRCQSERRKLPHYQAQIGTELGWDLIERREKERRNEK